MGKGIGGGKGNRTGRHKMQEGITPHQEEERAQLLSRIYAFLLKRAHARALQKNGGQANNMKVEGRGSPVLKPQSKESAK